MKTIILSIIFSILLQWLFAKEVLGQKKDTVWTLQSCIQYALQQNIQVQKSSLTNDINKVNADQARESRFPSLNASASQNFSWSKPLGLDGKYSNYAGQNSSSFGINSNVTLYNGGKIRNSIKQADINYQAGQYDVETMKESISLNILNAYLQILYAEEQVKNSEKQVEVTADQLRLAEERVKLGSISNADYLQVKSQLASEKQTLANAQSTLDIDRVTLMQLMEIPVTPNFYIVHPEFNNLISTSRSSKADSIYNIALGIKPQIKSADLNKQSAALAVDIAKAGYQPQLSLNGDISTGYNNSYGVAYDYQVSNRITPSVGLTLSIPIYQNRQARSKVDIAKINTQNAELSETDTKNQLRKAIEQACVDVSTAEKKFLASLEDYNANQESFEVASEKFNQGLLNSVDYLVQKTNLITAESNLLQAKYNLIFSNKILDFYSGVPLTL